VVLQLLKALKYARRGNTLATVKRFTATPVVMVVTVQLLANNRKETKHETSN
jgi:hypothetical protein